MTLYEVGDLINSTSSNIIAGQAVFLTVITGYLIVAYTVGRSLTKYQVGFINLAFLVATLSGFLGMFANYTQIAEYSTIKADLTGGLKVPDEVSVIWSIMFFSLRVLLICGALVFMWQARRTKTE